MRNGPASLALEQGRAGIAVNRRRARLRSLPGPVDQDVPVLSVRGANGEWRRGRQPGPALPG